MWYSMFLVLRDMEELPGSFHEMPRLPGKHFADGHCLESGDRNPTQANELSPHAYLIYNDAING